jgi:hypothetical protein
MADITPHEVVIWTDAARAPLVERVVGRMTDLHVLGVGAARKSDATALAQTLGATAGDDLRQMLIDMPARFVLIAAATGAGADDIMLALGQSSDVLTIEPPSSHLDSALAWEKGQAPPGRLVHVPMWRLSPSYLAAADPQQAIGKIASMSLTTAGSEAAGSLFARIYDAMDMVVGLLGLPDTIDAALVGPLAEAPDDLRTLAGHLTAHLRYPEAGVTLHASDRARQWTRRLDILGKDGQLRMDGRQYRLTTDDTAEGDEVLDEATVDPAELIARQWRWLIDHRHGPETVDRREILAACRTMLLSCRTAQSESPQTLLKMAGG